MNRRFTDGENQVAKTHKKNLKLGHLGGSVLEDLPLAQVMIFGSWDRVPNQAFQKEPASLSAYVSDFLSVSLMNK